MSDLVQPLIVTKPDDDRHPDDVLSLKEFIKLVKEEEDYWETDAANAKLMITRLRKIFYDQWGWDILISGAANISNRYEVKIEDVDPAPGKTKEVTLYTKSTYTPKHRIVIYRKDDKKYPELVGQVPEIIRDNNQEVQLPDGTYCDMGHILAGVDAHNHPAIVGVLTQKWKIVKLGPHVDCNADIVTWLGDIASSSADFLFDYLRTGNDPNSPESIDEQQRDINEDANGSDMLGNVDSFVIPRRYAVDWQNGKRFSEILEDYYLGSHGKPPYEKYRFQYFCKAVGLTGWDGERFANENSWLDYYEKQLRDNIAFQVASLTAESFKRYWLCFRIWCNGFKHVLKKRELLEIWLEALKAELKKEK